MNTTWWDTSFPAFGVRISPKGTKTFIVIHQARRTALGRYPIISLADARAEAKRLVAERTLGLTKPATITFSEAVTLFLTQYRRKPSTVKETTRLLNKHFLPRLGNKPLGEIKLRDVTATTDRLINECHPVEARNAWNAIKTAFKFIEGRKLIPESPIVQSAAPPAPKDRDRVLSKEELERFGAPACGLVIPWGIR